MRTVVTIAGRPATLRPPGLAAPVCRPPCPAHAQDMSAPLSSTSAYRPVQRPSNAAPTPPSWSPTSRGTGHPDSADLSTWPSAASRAGILTSVSVSALLGVVLLVAGAGLLIVGLLGWRRRLPRNRFAGVRTPATLRSEAAFVAANRIAAPPLLGAGAICAAGGAVALGTSGLALGLIVSMAGVSAFALVLAGGLLGHRVAAAVPARAGGCGDCTCRGEGCCDHDA